MSGPDSEKRALRQRLRGRTLPPAERARLSAALCAHVLASEAWRTARVVAAFVPMAEEADITPLLAEALRGKRLALPAAGADRRITFRLAASLEGLVPDAYGIPSPAPDRPEAEAIDLMLLPLTAADRDGHRLGKGAGCYDRWLAAHPSPGCRMGVALPHQVVGRVPAGPEDIPLDCLATPDGVLPCGGA